MAHCGIAMALELTYNVFRLERIVWKMLRNLPCEIAGCSN